jgi:membrane protease subunit HflC
MGIDKLIDIIADAWEQFLPFTVISHYQQGVRLRLGRKPSSQGIFKSATVLDPGFHWKIPFVDEILTEMVKTTTMNISEQSVTTLDGQSVVVAAVLKYSISDVEKLLLEVGTAKDALNDMAKGIIRDKIIQTNWADCNNSALTGSISKKLKHEATKWGITVEEITLTDLGLMRSIRILNEKP